MVGLLHMLMLGILLSKVRFLVRLFVLYMQEYESSYISSEVEEVREKSGIIMGDVRVKLILSEISSPVPNS